uniref:Uncharacterized protein n=1 Tax=Loa loa TaxID=7209 RepID=A0A1I7VI25_LOALO
MTLWTPETAGNPPNCLHATAKTFELRGRKTLSGAKKIRAHDVRILSSVNIRPQHFDS